MKSLWLLLVLSLLGLQVARGSPLTSISSTGSTSLSTVSGASTISAAPSLSWAANVSANSTSQNSLSINGSTNTASISGPVTVLKTIEVIPQPVPSDSSAGPSAFLEPTDNLILNVPLSASTAQHLVLPTISPLGKLASSSGPSASSTPQVQVPQPTGQAVKRPRLQPIVVGGITYVPAHAYHTHSNAIPWQEDLRPSQTQSGAVEWHEYYAKHDSNPDQGNQDEGGSESQAGGAGLPPVVVGGLTYRPIDKEVEPGGQTPAPETVAGPSMGTEQLATSPLVEVGPTPSQVQGGSMAASPQYAQSPGASGPLQTQFPRPASPSTASVLVLSSPTSTALPGSSGFIINSSARLPGSPAITINSISYSLNPSAALTARNTTILLATTRLGASEGSSGFLTAANETFLPLGSTAISIDGTTLSISGPAINKDGTTFSLASGGLVVGSSTFAFAASASNPAVTTTSGTFTPISSFAISGQSVVPASPSTFIIVGETFTAYPSGLAIDGTEVFEGSTAITVSGTPISLGSSDIVIGTRTIPIASITGLGPALSSGLSASASASGDSSGPTSTSRSGKGSHQSAAGQSKISGNAIMGWFALIALTIAWYEVM